MLSCFLQNLSLDIQYQIRTVPGEQLNRVLRGFIGTQQAVFLVAAASVYRCIKNIVQTAYGLCSALLQYPLGAGSAVDITGEDILCIFQDFSRIVCKITSTSAPDPRIISL